MSTQGPTYTVSQRENVQSILPKTHLLAAMVGICLSVGGVHHVLANDPQTPSSANRQTACPAERVFTEENLPPVDDSRPESACPHILDSMPVLRTAPVFVTPTVEPVSSTRRTVRKGVAPEVLEFLRQMHGKILEAREYPLNAQKLGLQGTTTVMLTLTPDGTAKIMRVRKTSGHAVLDDAALEAVQRILPFRPPPEAGDRPMELNIPIGFALK